MKLGDIVTLKHDRVAVQLLSDSMEHNTNVKKTVIGGPIDMISFRRGQIATVIEVNQKNKARVKILYDSGMWWGNISDMLILEDVSNNDAEL